jgi:methylenetetrahydrofolate dehydrogenase (NADP+)/methenyltetrahydrofolate cyclohydrolase
MILNGREIALNIRKKLQETIALIKGKKPHLAFILVGDHPASRMYVSAKKRACLQTGITSTLIELSSQVTQKELIHHIHQLNQNREIDAILIQLPLPPQIHTAEVMSFIDPMKDVDGFHPINMGKLLLGEETGMIPCTPLGVQKILIESNLPIERQHVVIVGRSNIVAKPLAALLMQKKKHANATVTIAHSYSSDLASITRSADILVSATGNPHFIKANMVKPKSIVIDVGIHKLADGTIVGDVDFQNVAPLVSYITPVPGGVGPMTIAMLLQNTLLTYQKGLSL